MLVWGNNYIHIYDGKSKSKAKKAQQQNGGGGGGGGVRGVQKRANNWPNGLVSGVNIIIDLRERQRGLKHVLLRLYYKHS